MDQGVAFAIPYNVIRDVLSDLNVTETDHEKYWHVHMVEDHSQYFSILLPKRPGKLDVSKYAIPLGEARG